VSSRRRIEDCAQAAEMTVDAGAVWPPLAAHAQQPALPVVEFLHTEATAAVDFGGSRDLQLV
jgi:hypothetical protein